jgi:hypothetical protein
MLVRGPELKHFKLVCAKRVGHATALAEIVGEIVQRGGIAESDSHEDRPGALDGAGGFAPHGLPRRTAGSV